MQSPVNAADDSVLPPDDISVMAPNDLADQLPALVPACNFMHPFTTSDDQPNHTPHDDFYSPLDDPLKTLSPSPFTSLTLLAKSPTASRLLVFAQDCFFDVLYQGRSGWIDLNDILIISREALLHVSESQFHNETMQSGT
jgi:hypothetical protein